MEMPNFFLLMHLYAVKVRVEKPITETQPGIKEALEKLVCDSTFGDPMSPLLWTTKSIRKLAYMDEVDESHLLCYNVIKST